jgi:hypothetical protein
VRAQSRWTAVGAVVATAAALLVAGCTTEDGPSGSSCALATPPPAAGSVDSAGIKVTEQGFSTSSAEFPMVSIGAVLENTTDQVAYRTRVVFDAFDAAGSIVGEDQVKYTMIEVPIIAPKAKVAVGDMFHASTKVTLTKVTVTPAVTAWMPAGDGSTGLAPVTSTVVAGSGKRAADGSGELYLTSRGDNCTALISRGIALVYRDAGGAIVGGAIDGLEKLYACEPDDEQKEVSIVLPDVIPAAADLDKTQITPMCDLQPARRVSASGEPVN